MRVKTFSRVLESSLQSYCFSSCEIGEARQPAPGQRNRECGNVERADRVGVKNGNMVASVQKPEDGFEKALEEMRDRVGKAGIRQRKAKIIS